MAANTVKIPTDWSTVTVPELMAGLSRRNSSPSGGAAAAASLASAAALVAMSARFADGRRGDSAALAEEADAARDRALVLLDMDAASFARVLEARRWGNAGALEAALESACDVPLRLLALAVRVAEMGTDLTHRGNPLLAGDARVAVCLAIGAGRAAAAIVEENLGADVDDALVERARDLEAQLSDLEGPPGGEPPWPAADVQRPVETR